jgi:hypothetical protein
MNKRSPRLKQKNDEKTIGEIVHMKKKTFIVEMLQVFFGACVRPSTTQKKRKGPRGTSQMMSLNTRCP